MDWAPTIRQIRNRLPELEHHIVKLGTHFPLHALPPGLFKDVATGVDCITDIDNNLDKVIDEKASERVRLYWSNLLNQKIHVLVHICRNQPRRKKESHSLVLDKISTRNDWLAQIEAKQISLTTQRESMTATLKSMQARNDREAIQILQNELLDIEAQLTSLFK